MDSEGRAHRVAAQKRHSAAFLARGLDVCLHYGEKRVCACLQAPPNRVVFFVRGALKVDSEARAYAVGRQKRHGAAFLGRGLDVCLYYGEKRVCACLQASPNWVVYSPYLRFRDCASLQGAEIPLQTTVHMLYFC